jgi:hypothetical protein
VNTLLDLRIVRWPFKLLYIAVAYGVLFLLSRLLVLAHTLELVVDVIDLVLNTGAVLYGARIFRSWNEELKAPRELWRMTARRPMSKRLGVTFTVLAALEMPLLVLGILSAAGVDLGEFSFYGSGLVGLAFAVAQYGVLAFLYLRSARHLPFYPAARPSTVPIAQD